MKELLDVPQMIYGRSCERFLRKGLVN